MENDQNSQPTPVTPPEPTPTQPVSEPAPVIVPEYTETPYTPPKNPKLARVIAGGIIAIIIIVGLAIFLVALNKNQEKVEVSPAESSTKDEKVEVYLTESEKQALIKDILAKVKTAATSIDSAKTEATTKTEFTEAETVTETETAETTEADDVIAATYTVQDIYDTDNPAFLASGAKVPTSTDKSFGFVITATDQPELIQLMVQKSVAELEKLGFTEYKDAVQDISGGHGWYDKTNKIICTPVRDSYNTLSLSCGHTSWIHTDKVALVNALAEAYKEKAGEYPAFLNAKVDDISDSPYTPYQKITATLLGAAGLFYRPSTNGDWVFFAATQAPIKCAEYYEEVGARRAFQGEVCLDNNGAQATVKEGS